MMQRVSWILLLAFPLMARATLFQGPLSSSMGGTGRAAMDGAEGAFLNPALLPLLKDYEVDGYYRDGSVDPGQHRQAWGLGAGDNNADAAFPGTLHYIRLRDTGLASGPANGELWHVAVGKAIGNFSFGASLYRLSEVVENDQEYVQWNGSLGALWIINQDMGVAYVLNNLAKPGSEVPMGLRQDMQEGVGFFATLAEVARLRFDITRNEVFNPDKKMVYMVGMENQAGGFTIMRWGYRLDDQAGQRYLTAGVGFHGPRLKLDYSFEKNLYGTSDALHSVDIRLPF